VSPFTSGGAPSRSPSTRSVQVGFFLLLLVCAAQLAFWMWDEWRYTQVMTDRLAEALAATGAGSEQLTQLARDRAQRLNRYAWEGAFFLAVLLAAMGVVLKALREEAELRRRQERFLAAVSHEFKSPLASLRLSVETLSLRDPAVAERAELVRRIVVELGRLERMVANTLDTSRLASGGEPHPERVELDAIVTEMTDELAEFAAECEVRVETHVLHGVVVHADRDGVRTVVRNLLHNAIKASPRGGVVQVQAQAEGHDVVLEVSDDGVGFPPKEAPRLFEQFYRVEGDGRGRMQGTGLGLYLVARLVAHAGGRVRAQSAGNGLGAVFTVRWPRPAEERP
jgi:two-component system, OmpR family, phosphate regulon sensor histidine kinase PhoR